MSSIPAITSNSHIPPPTDPQPQVKQPNLGNVAEQQVLALQKQQGAQETHRRRQNKKATQNNELADHQAGQSSTTSKTGKHINEMA